VIKQSEERNFLGIARSIADLAIGGLRKDPVVLTDEQGNDSIAIRSIQHFCLGFDHRIIDGADAEGS